MLIRKYFFPADEMDTEWQCGVNHRFLYFIVSWGAVLTFRSPNRGIGLAKSMKSMRPPQSARSEILQIVLCGPTEN